MFLLRDRCFIEFIFICLLLFLATSLFHLCGILMYHIFGSGSKISVSENYEGLTL